MNVQNGRGWSVILVAEELAAYNKSWRMKMKYLLMAYVNEAGWPQMTKAEQEQGAAAYAAFMEAMKKAGVIAGSNRLQPSSVATTVRVTNGKSQVLDGPYADSKEQLGGYFLIDVPDLDAALAWAARCPATGHGVVEVRPVWDMGAASSTAA
jgi:hypothetical protein